MIEMACPGCGRAGQVPKEKLYTRLVCRKCHVVFHMETSGRTVLGEPHSPTDPKDPKKKKEKDKAKKAENSSFIEGFRIPTVDELVNFKDNFSDGSFPVKPVAAGLGVLVVGWVVFSIFSRPPESVAERARIVVEAVTHDDLNRVKGYASDDTRDDVVKWYEMIHDQLENARKSWPSKEATVQVLVVEDDPKSNRGEVEAFILPTGSTTMSASVAPPPVAPPPPGAKPSKTASAPALAGPISFHLKWDFNGSHWWLDGKQTLAIASAAPMQ